MPGSLGCCERPKFPFPCLVLVSPTQARSEKSHYCRCQKTLEADLSAAQHRPLIPTAGAGQNVGLLLIQNRSVKQGSLSCAVFRYLGRFIFALTVPCVDSCCRNNPIYNLWCNHIVIMQRRIISWICIFNYDFIIRKPLTFNIFYHP